LHQLAIRTRLLEGREVRSLDVLDDGEDEAIVLADFLHQRRDRRQAGHFRRAQPALAGDQLEAAPRRRPYQNWLEDAVGGDRRSQFGYGGFVEAFSRLA